MSERERVYQDVLEAIGDTPIVRLGRVAEGFQSEVWAKLEFMNPGGSTKDRAASYMVAQAEARGDLHRGGTIVDGTCGNTGIGLAMAAAVRGYRSIFVVPDKQSDEKVRALRAFGAEVVVTPTAVEPDDPRSFCSVSAKLAAETPGAFFANQFHNPDNVQAHYEQTGPEIWRQLGGRLDVFVAGIGSGGTLSGAGRFLKEQDPAIRVVGVDPVGSLYYDCVKTGRMTEAYGYAVEGIGGDFLPSTLETEVIDDVVRVTDRECFLMTRDVVRREGIFCGGSSGAAVVGALKWLRENDRPGQRVLVLLPDTGRHYLGRIFDDGWMRQNRFLDSGLESGTVRDLLGSTPRRQVVSAQSGEPLRVVAERMRAHDVSQLPVMDGGHVIGIVTENDVLAALLGGPGAAASPARDVAHDAWSAVDAQTTIPVLADLFTRVKIALVMERDVVVNVITKIDLIDWMSRRGR